MRIFALSDVHLEYRENAEWLFGLSRFDFQKDLLILAGDVSAKSELLEKALSFLKNCFQEVFFVPGNHDLWVRNRSNGNSLDKFQQILRLAEELGIHTRPWHLDAVSIMPLFAWYDYSFGEPSAELRHIWMDYAACQWPPDFNQRIITRTFLDLNEKHLADPGSFMISFSHFLPRIDLMPPYIPAHKQNLYPVLGTDLLNEQIKRLGSRIHVYGHSHVNRHVIMDRIAYINNAFGYPHEGRIAAKKLLCIHEMI
ncbi:MAG: metallophosphoesterase [Desulfobacteraceae bacterium]|nr:MAG: metallophosphoesterase [Desulfobacteraceae bacterium]